MPEDIRWKQRFSNYTRALQRLAEAVDLAGERELSNLEKQGLIKYFGSTHELAWNVLKDFLEHQGISNLIGSKDAVRSAFKNGLVDDGEAWMSMILDRNRSSHTYNLEIAEEIAGRILTVYYSEFLKLVRRFDALLADSDE